MSTAAAIPSTTRKSFGSDNHARVHPAIMAAIADANSGDAVAYGADPWTSTATAELKRRTGARGEVYLVLNGSGANVVGLDLLLGGRHEAVICAESAHINTDECGAAERVLGTKLLTVAAPGGKLTPALIAARLAGRGDEHFAQPSVVTLTQSTEFGTCYSLEELTEIRDFCTANRLRLYIDGARLANAAAHLGCGLDELARNADAFSFGGTKNGAMGVEALVVMDPSFTPSATYMRKQHGQLASKMRFLGAQLGALLDDDLWYRNAANANAMATRLAAGLAGIPGVEIVYPVQSDAVFARLDKERTAALREGWMFHVWDEQESIVRWMTAFDTQESDVDEFLAAIAATATGA
jgi:threonine aldolase